MGCNKLSNNNKMRKIVIEVGYDIYGKRIRKTENFYGTNEEYKKRKNELMSQYYHKSNMININDLTFKQYGAIFIEYCHKSKVSKITIRGYEQMLNIINPIIGHLKLKKITTFQLDNMYQQIALGKKGKPLAPKTMLNYYNLVGGMFKQAKKWKFVDSNPNEDAKKPKLEKKERNFYDDNQAIELLKCVENESIKYKTLINLALDSGARRSEICALRWSDLDFETGKLVIDNSLKVIHGEVDEENAKTSYSIRTIYLGVDTLNVLKEYKEWQDNYIKQMGNKWKGTDRIFTSKDGNYMHPDTCGKIINKITNKYNLPKLTFHEIRHTNASLLNDSGVSAKLISQRLGHSNTIITTNIYTHTFENAKMQSANAIGKLQKMAKN